MRFFGLVATGVLLGVGAAAALTIIPDAKLPQVTVPESAPAAPSKAATHAKKHAKNAPAAAKLTVAQRAQRAAAVEKLSTEGYRPVTLAAYAPTHVLRVLVGKGDGGRRAFFWAGSKYIGNDAATDSDSITVARAGNRSVALSYKLVDGTSARVLFRWDGKHLAPQTAIPSAAQRNAVG